MSSSDSTQRMFQLKLNPLTGNSEWVVVEESTEEESANMPKSHLSSTSYLDMLNDTRRNRAFRQAIEKTITKPCHVLDIGAGTGLLSMMAARAMASIDEHKFSRDEGMVSACESYLPMVKLMRKVLRLNGMEKNIRIFNKRSDELEVGLDLASRADVLVSEILDSELLGEGLIPTLQHAHEKLLVKNPLTVPYRATTFGQLVESKFLWKLHDLHNNEAQALDGVHLSPPGLETIIHVKPQQYAMHCDALVEDIRLLSEPFKIFEIDFWKRPDSHGETELEISSIADGSVHAVVSWWVLQLDCEGVFSYSTAPRWISSTNSTQDLLPNISGDAGWCDHWKQCIWFVPGMGISVSKDDHVHLHAVHDNTSISYKLDYDYKRTQHMYHDLCSRNYQLALSPERIAVYGDSEWRSTMFTAIKDAVDLLIGEPFYYGNEGMLPWQNLRFWNERTMLDPVLSEDVVIMPCKGILKACAMSLPDLWRSRSFLTQVEGFDHTTVNATLGACGNEQDSCDGPCIPYFVWQCGDTKELSEIYTLMEFDLSKPISPCFGKAKVEFTSAGMCHGFVLWIDWVMDAEKSIVLSAGPDCRYHKQGVKLFREPVTVGISGVHVSSECCSTELETYFDPSNGELTVKANFP